MPPALGTGLGMCYILHRVEIVSVDETIEILEQ